MCKNDPDEDRERVSLVGVEGVRGVVLELQAEQGDGPVELTTLSGSALSQRPGGQDQPGNNWRVSADHAPESLAKILSHQQFREQQVVPIFTGAPQATHLKGQGSKTERMVTLSQWMSTWTDDVKDDTVPAFHLPTTMVLKNHDG